MASSTGSRDGGVPEVIGSGERIWSKRLKSSLRRDWLEGFWKFCGGRGKRGSGTDSFIVGDFGLFGLVLVGVVRDVGLLGLGVAVDVGRGGMALAD